ncbi:MAG: phosphate acyltransferase PlsX [Paracoccaceae bacterium]|nr:phosphate acyltransferase PlsX [Paracoccaceae bacterium]
MTGTDSQHPSDESPSVVISVDAMGGDLGPASVIDGLCKFASQNDDARFVVHGDQHALDPLVLRQELLKDRCEVRHAERTVAMGERPSHVMRHGRNTSMWAALKSVGKGESTVAVSCGNTGALLALAMSCLRRAPGINRPAIAVLWPSRDPDRFNVVLDVGADVRADAEDLLQFALMGVSYSRNSFDRERPRVGLLNVGTEEHKGRDELRAAYGLIAAAAETNGYEFAGFVEGGDLPSRHVDVIVTDGFTGNVALKTAEGTASLISDLLKEAFRHSLLSRLGALCSYTSLGRFRRRIDPRRVNGGVFLGLNGIVVKSHGSADSTSVSAAVTLAYRLSRLRFHEKLAARVASGAATIPATDAGTDEQKPVGAAATC